MFGGIYFGQYWPEEAVVAAATPRPDPGGAEKRRKRKHRPEDEIWPQPWQYQDPPKPKSSPSPVPVESLSPAAETPTRPIAVVLPQVSRDLVEAAAPRASVIRITDPAIAARAAEMRLRLRRELEEEEILMLMGFFD